FTGAIARKTALDDLPRIPDRSELPLEAIRLLACWIFRSTIFPRCFKQAPTDDRLARLGHGDRLFEDFAVADRFNRKPVLEIPGGEASFCGVISQIDVARFQGLVVATAEDRHQNAAARMGTQRFPVDVERIGVGRFGPPFEYVEPPWIVGEMH